MYICCSICKELFVPQSEVCVTKCGHLYHERCISQWSARNQTCPQCRAKLKEKPHRVYFDVENDVEVDPSVLQVKIDKLSCTLQTKNNEISELNKKIEGLEAVRISLRQDLIEQEEKIRGFRETMRRLKEEIKTLAKEKENLQPLKESNEILRAKVESMKKLEALLQGTEDEVQNMLKNTPVTPLAVHQLCIYVEALKQQLKKCEEKYKVEKRQLQHHYTTVSRQLRAEKRNKTDRLNQTTNAVIGHSSTCDKVKRKLSESTPNSSRLEIVHKSTCHLAQKTPKVLAPQTLKTGTIINNLEKCNVQCKSDSSNDSLDIEILFPGPSKQVRCSHSLNCSIMHNYKGTGK